MPPGLYVGLSSGNVGIGTTGFAGTSNLVNVSGKDVYIGASTRYASYTRYGSNLSVPSADGRINGVNITALNKRTRTSGAAAADCVKSWTTRASAADNNWLSICWAAELSLFVAVASTGPNNGVMTSPDGVVWTARSSTSNNIWWSVCWAAELSLFVAVAQQQPGEGNSVMTSPNGITWTARVSASNNNWRSVCWASELSLFVAVASSGTGNRVMTSPDGITWTARTSAADNDWQSVCWAAELSLFVAVAVTGTGNRVMTSPDGINWTARTSASDNGWLSVCWAAELSLFVAVAYTGTGNRVMTSQDGITWTARTSAANNEWYSVCWAPELSLFAAVANSGTGNRVMTSSDGITWTARTSAADNGWLSICWAAELSIFAAVASFVGGGNRVMTSAIGMPNSKSVVKALPSQMMVDANGRVGIGTTNPQYQLHLATMGSYSYIRGDGLAGLILDAKNNAVYISITDTLRYYMNSSSISPVGDNVCTLGGSGNRWVSVYAVNGTIQTSDENLKEFQPLIYGLNELLKIETIKFKWKSQLDLPDSDPSKNYEYYGFKANNLKPIFPELVYDEAEPAQVNYSELLPVIVNSIKDQQNEIQELKAQVALLLSKL